MPKHHEINNESQSVKTLFVHPGKIAWARQLYRKITLPIEHFQKRDELLKSLEGKKIVKTYNKMAAVLLEYEVLYHRGWCVR